MDSAELIARFKARPFDKAEQMLADRIRADALRLATKIDGASADSREKSLAITALEEAVMWSNRSMSRFGS